MTHKSVKGQLLLDGGRLAGSWFHRTVVLVCEHNAEGAFGLVLTKASDSRVEDVLEGEFGDRIGGLTLYGGGPVQLAALSFLRGIDQALDVVGATQALVLPGLALGHQLDDLLALAQPTPTPPPVRVFAGYAGWSAGQLDDELLRDSWLVEPATLEWVFVVPPEQLWRQILKRRPNWQERLLADSPEDVGWN